jgi:hypothetical protein
MPNDPRQQLREAIEQNAVALADLHHCEIVLQRTRDLHCDLVARKAERFGDLDNQLASARAHLIKQALDSGDEEEAGRFLTQPVEGFASAQIACSQLAEQIAGIEDSLPVLESEMLEARKAAEMADYNVDCARAAVMAKVAEEMAREFHTRLHELRLMSIRMASMSNRPMRRDPRVQSSNGPFYGQGSSTIPMPPIVLEAVAEPIMGSFDRKNPPARKNDIARAVADWWAALKNDPLATLDPETREGMFRHDGVRSNVSDDLSLRAAE